MKKTEIFAIAVIVLLGVSFVAAFPFGKGFAGEDLTDEEKATMNEQREAIDTAIENEDYETWKSLMEAQITEENFQKAVERHKEMEEMREEREANREEMEEKMQELREKMDEARENEDFDTLKELEEEAGIHGGMRPFHRCPNEQDIE